MNSDGWIQLDFDWNFIKEGCGDKVISKEHLYNYPICCYGNHAGSCPPTQVHIKEYVNYTPTTYKQWCDNNSKNVKIAVFGSIDLCSTVTNPTIDYPAPTSPCKPVLTLSALSGSGQIAEVCKTLDAPFRAAVNDEKGAPKSSVSVDWGNIASPKDAAGASATGAALVATPNSTGSTNASGISEIGFKFGNIPGEYSVEANCPGCDKGSPQKFKATASCHVIASYTQGQSPWGDKLYAKWCKLYDSTTGDYFMSAKCEFDSNGEYKQNKTYEYTDAETKKKVIKHLDYKPVLIKTLGCMMTAGTMVLDAYRYTMNSKAIDPQAMNDLMLNNNGFDGPNFDLSKLSKVTTPQLKLTFRIDFYSGISVRDGLYFLDYFTSKCIPVIAKVHNSSTGNDHFVLVTKKVGGEYLINDPGYKTRINLSSYDYTILGVRVLENDKGVCKQ